MLKQLNHTICYPPNIGATHIFHLRGVYAVDSFLFMCYNILEDIQFVKYYSLMLCKHNTLISIHFSSHNTFHFSTAPLQTVFSKILLTWHNIFGCVECTVVYLL